MSTLTVGLQRHFSQTIPLSTVDDQSVNIHRMSKKSEIVNCILPQGLFSLKPPQPIRMSAQDEGTFFYLKYPFKQPIRMSAQDKKAGTLHTNVPVFRYFAVIQLQESETETETPFYVFHIEHLGFARICQLSGRLIPVYILEKAVSTRGPASGNSLKGRLSGKGQKELIRWSRAPSWRIYFMQRGGGIQFAGTVQ